MRSAGKAAICIWCGADGYGAGINWLEIGSHSKARSCKMFYDPIKNDSRMILECELAEDRREGSRSRYVSKHYTFFFRKVPVARLGGEGDVGVALGVSYQRRGEGRSAHD